MNKLVFAAVISEIQPSDIFLTVKARICEAPAANLNGARVTEAFIDEIVSNKDKYVGLPLYADVRALTNGNYRRLGHLYDSKTGEFHSTQIGSFYEFEKEEFDGRCYLVGYVRIAKRNKKLSNALLDLFADTALKFSFEVSVGEYTELDDGTIEIDASESNYLEGTAIVTFPACEEAVALELVAQHKADDIEGGDEGMADNKNLVAEEAIEQPVAAEENPEANSEVNAEAETKVEAAAETEDAACKDKKNAEEESEVNAEDETKVETAEQQNAAVVIDETDKVEHTTYAYDTESGVNVYQNVEVTTSVSHVEPDAQIVEADDGIHIAEEGGEGAAAPVEIPAEETGEESGDSGVVDEPKDEPKDEAKGETKGDAKASEDEDSGDAADMPDPDSMDSKKKTAEQLIAELAEVVESLKNEIAELKEQKVNAEAKTVTAEINPFVSDISKANKYGLLEKENKRIDAYTLLEKY